jgi:serine/threonine-protein kinase
MSPEQVSGDPVGPAADIYALGAILFEILAGETLHRRENALAATLAPHDGSPAKRRPDREIAPELDTACRDALKALPGARASAHDLGERVQRYLDGDRDLEQRKAIAIEEHARANAELARGDRGAAMQAAGRALALDPKSRDAAALVGRLMLEPPERMPPEVVSQVATIDQTYARAQWRAVMIAYLSCFATLPLVIVQGVTDWRPMTALYGLIGVLSALSWRNMVKPRVALTIALNFALLFVLARVTTPVIIFPGAVIVCGVSWMSYPSFIDRPYSALTLLVALMLGPVAVEELGIVSRTWSIAAGRVELRSTALALTNTSPFTIIAVGVIMAIAGGYMAHAIARSRRDMQRKLELQAWHLRKLLPH